MLYRARGVGRIDSPPYAEPVGWRDLSWVGRLGWGGDEGNLSAPLHQAEAPVFRCPCELRAIIAPCAVPSSYHTLPAAVTHPKIRWPACSRLWSWRRMGSRSTSRRVPMECPSS